MTPLGVATPTPTSRDTVLDRIRLLGSAQHLALVRIALALHVATVLTSPVISLLGDLGGAHQDTTATMIPGAIERFVESRGASSLVAVGLVADLLVLVGLATRLALPVLLVCFVLTQNYFYRLSQWHDDWLYFNADLLVLCFARCADRWSLDALLRRAPPPPPSQRYRWPIEVMITWFAGLYVAAGIAKVFPLRKGIVWLGGGSARQLAVVFLHDSPIFWLTRHSLFDYSNIWPFRLGAIGTAIVELGAVSLLFTRRAYLPVLIALLALHIGIALVGIPGFVQIALVGSVLFLKPESFPDWKLRNGSRAGGN